MVAIANSGGGVLVVGLDSKGNPSKVDVKAVVDLDPAKVADQVFKYTGTHFSDLQIIGSRKDGSPLALMTIGPSITPIVFSRPGTYPTDPGKQATAFSRGTLYVRHGAKSEPASTADLQAVLDRLVRQARREMMAGMRKVVEAPAGSLVRVLPPEIRDSDDPGAVPVRIVDDPKAQAYRLVDVDRTHPFRQKELIEGVKKQLPPGMRFNQFDIQAIRRAHKIESRPELFHKLRFGSPQYSPRFVEWIVEQYRKDPRFFEKARKAVQKE